MTPTVGVGGGGGGGGKKGGKNVESSLSQLHRPISPAKKGPILKGRKKNNNGGVKYEEV